MEIGLPDEVKLSIYLKMDQNDKTGMAVSKILQKIIDDEPIDSEEKKKLLEYIRSVNSVRY